MDPTVVAAWIAAGVSVLTLVGTLAAQYLGYRATSRDAAETAEEQRKQLDRTLAEQQTMIDQLVPTDPLGVSLTSVIDLIEALVAHAEFVAAKTTVAHGAAILIATEHLLVPKTDWFPAIGTCQIRFFPAAIDIALRHFCSSESGN
jgi:hypothetical protein